MDHRRTGGTFVLKRMTAFRQLTIDLRIIRKDFRVFRWIRQLLQNLVDGFRRLKKAGEVTLYGLPAPKGSEGLQKRSQGVLPFLTKLLLHPGRICGNGGTFCLLGISGDHDYQLVSGFQGTVCLTDWSDTPYLLPAVEKAQFSGQDLHEAGINIFATFCIFPR